MGAVGTLAVGALVGDRLVAVRAVTRAAATRAAGGTERLVGMTAAADWAADPSLLPVAEIGGLVAPAGRFALGGLFALLVARATAIHRYR